MPCKADTETGRYASARARSPELAPCLGIALNGAWDAYYDDDENCREIVRFLDEQRMGRSGQPRLGSTGFLRDYILRNSKTVSKTPSAVREKQTMA
jgi:hypothetical protein